eukprot:COSAG02_NODE_3657_length_6407_cov_2.609192_1_plen_149_part_00
MSLWTRILMDLVQFGAPRRSVSGNYACSTPRSEGISGNRLPTVIIVCPVSLALHYYSNSRRPEWFAFGYGIYVTHDVEWSPAHDVTVTVWGATLYAMQVVTADLLRDGTPATPIAAVRLRFWFPQFKRPNVISRLMAIEDRSVKRPRI